MILVSFTSILLLRAVYFIKKKSVSIIVKKELNWRVESKAYFIDKS
ncbi:hypothetical protein [Clostridium thermobutyricum]|nr:hypothetical protein [Clostridium thermobutyricum]